MIQKLSMTNLETINKDLSSFIWNFNHGKNIMYNFEILQALYKARETAENECLLHKPITIQIVSIIEAILIDFLTRISQATKHLPRNIEMETLGKIKIEIDKKKKPYTIGDKLGERIYFRRKMYKFNEIVEIFRKYEIFGPQNDKIYEQFFVFADMRNRVHIENYHENLENEENLVFTFERLEILEAILFQLWDKMIIDFKRPW